MCLPNWRSRQSNRLMKTFARLALLCALTYGSAMAADDYTMYIGTYTGQKSQGIYQARFDSQSGRLTAPELAVKTQSPSFLAAHPSLPVLYAAGEGSNIGVKREGAVTAFRIDAQNGQLTEINQQPSGGGGPCHVFVDATGKCLLVANYGSGSVASFPIDEDGKTGAASSVIQHAGSSVNKQRQEGPHAHQIVTDSLNRRAYVCDLGLDKVLIYALEPASAKLRENQPPYCKVAPGAGPRHLTFTPDGRYEYVVNEMGCSVSAFRVDPGTGGLHEIQTLSTLPADFKGENSCAEIQVHPSGKFLYASNRGHNSIAVYALSGDGTMKLVQHESSGGKTPRFFALDPGGNWLLAANQDSDNVTVLKVDTATGKLQSTGRSIEVGKPVCLVFRKR